MEDGQGNRKARRNSSTKGAVGPGRVCFIQAARHRVSIDSDREGRILIIRIGVLSRIWEYFIRFIYRIAELEAF